MWTLQMSILQYLVLVIKLTPINTVSLKTVFLIPQNQCYLGNTCILIRGPDYANSINLSSGLLSPFDIRMFHWARTRDGSMYVPAPPLPVESLLYLNFRFDSKIGRVDFFFSPSDNSTTGSDHIILRLSTCSVCALQVLRLSISIKSSVFKTQNSTCICFRAKINQMFLVQSAQCTEVRFTSFLFGSFTTMTVMNPPEKKLKKAPLCSGLV